MQRRSAAQPNKPPMHAERFEKVYQLSTHIPLPTFSHLSLTRKNHDAPTTASDNHPTGGGDRDCERDGLDRDSGPGRGQHRGPELGSEVTSISVWARPRPYLLSSGIVGGALENAILHLAISSMTHASRPQSDLPRPRSASTLVAYRRSATLGTLMLANVSARLLPT